MTPEELAERFAGRFGSPPAGVWRAPGRVNLIGEHTDYNDGFVLPFAIQLEAFVAARRTDDGVVSCVSVETGDAPDARAGELAPGGPRGWWSYVHGVADGVARAARGASAGAEILVTSDVPPGAGLSSSAALECAVAVALRDLWDAPLDARELALVAVRAEHEFAGVPCGLMDQLASMLGREGHALLIDTRSLDVEPVPFPPTGVTAVIVDTGTSRDLAGSAYAERRAACEEAARTLGVRALRDVTLDALERARPRLDEVVFRRARHVVTENARVLEAADALRAGDLARLADAMAGSHRSLRDDYEVSTPELDLAVDAALRGGATAARMTGAGFGGAVVALVPDDAADAVRDAVVSAFARAHPAVSRVIPVRPSAGAGRLR